MLRKQYDTSQDAWKAFLIFRMDLDVGIWDMCMVWFLMSWFHVYIYISDSSDRVHEMTRSVFLRTGLPGFAGTQVKRSRIWLSKSCEF